MSKKKKDRREPSPATDKVIHVIFGPGGGRVSEPPPAASASPEAGALPPPRPRASP